MSAFLLGLGFRANMGSKTRKLVLLKLIDACEDDGTRIFPAVDTVARAAECSGRQVQRELRLFEEKGLLRLVRRGGKRPGDTSEYAMNLDMLERIAKIGWNAFFGVAEAADDVDSMGDTVSPMDDGDAGVMGDISGAMGDTGVTPMGDRSCHPTPPTTPPLDPSVERARETASEKAYWRLMKRWPGLRGMPKAKTRLAWERLSGDEQRDAVERFPAWLAAVEKTHDHVPGPYSYFHERLWTEIPADIPTSAIGPKLAAPYGKLWMAERIVDLLRKPYGAIGALTTFEQRQVQLSQKTAEELYREKIRRSGWTLVNAMHERAADMKGYPCRPELMPLAESFRAAHRDGDLYAAWRREHERRGWPFIDDTRPPEWVHFPPVPDGWEADPDAAVWSALEEFAAQVREVRGDEHAA